MWDAISQIVDLIVYGLGIVMIVFFLFIWTDT
jgi:Na+-transporting methylmalonyl-CoA/oxaloacetate decarboxylase gamma subunit